MTAGAPAGHRWATINRTIIGRSPFGHRAAIDGFAMDGILIWTFNFRMFIVIVNNFYC